MLLACHSGRVLNDHKPCHSKRQAALVHHTSRSAFCQPHTTTIRAHLPCAHAMRWKTPVALVAILAFMAMHDLYVAEVCLSSVHHCYNMRPCVPCRQHRASCPVCSGRTCQPPLPLCCCCLHCAVHPLSLSWCHDYRSGRCTAPGCQAGETACEMR